MGSYTWYVPHRLLGPVWAIIVVKVSAQQPFRAEKTTFYVPLLIGSQQRDYIGDIGIVSLHSILRSSKFSLWIWQTRSPVRKDPHGEVAWLLRGNLN